MSDSWIRETRTSYDADAAGYAKKVHGLLDRSPYLRASLALFAELVRAAGGGPAADIGCGPGYVTRHLHSLGLDAFGIDLSPEMIAIAKRDYPDLRFEVGTMTHLAEAGIQPSVGAIKSSYDNALAETINGLYKTKLIKPRKPWRTVDEVEYATAEWVDWFNNHRLYEYCGDVPPVELEKAYYARKQRPAAG